MAHGRTEVDVSEMLQASIYLKGILPLMEDLVQFDPDAAAAIAGQSLVLQFEVRDGPVAHLCIDQGQISHGTGRHASPDIRLFFRTPQLLNRLFAGEDVRPGIRKGFTRLSFLTKKFPVLSERLSYYLEGEGRQISGLKGKRFLVQLGVHAMLGGMATVANDDISLADIADSTPFGTLLVSVLPDGPHGTFAKIQHNGSFEFVATCGGKLGHANATMEFANLDIARQVLDGKLSAVVAINSGQMYICGYLPLIEKANIFLGRFARMVEA
jgi:hypothetical protein